MSAPVTIYIARPATERGRWRVTCPERPVEEVLDHDTAIDHAVMYARLMETAGKAVVVKIERPDGSWVVYGGRA
jgi:hypothetical protein